MDLRLVLFQLILPQDTLCQFVFQTGMLFSSHSLRTSRTPMDIHIGSGWRLCSHLAKRSGCKECHHHLTNLEVTFMLSLQRSGKLRRNGYCESLPGELCIISNLFVPVQQPWAQGQHVCLPAKHCKPAWHLDPHSPLMPHHVDLEGNELQTSMNSG